ncbi:MAG: gamma-glutamyltransferase [Chloroflexota bacterium]|nr:gamma-glutamyltransferase [Chloroflexota bacterium]
MSSRTTWRYDRDEATSPHGVVAAKHELAAEAGAEVLREGGNAIDAVVAAGFVAGVVEPFMSGLGGGGFLVAHFPERDERILVDHPMVAPAAATPGMYALAESGNDADMFGWRKVEGDANIHGHLAAAVPGTVAGLALALEEFGTLSRQRVLAPAIKHAADGFHVTWHTALMIGLDLALLNRFPATRATFTDNGFVPTPYPGWRKPLRQPELAETLRLVADQGAQAFYEGAPARAIAAEMRDHGGLISEADLAGYRPVVTEPLRGSYRGYEVLTSPPASGGPTVLETLNLIEQANLSGMGHNSDEALHWIAEACLQAFTDRLALLGDPAFVAAPWEALISKRYAADQVATFSPDSLRNPAPALPTPMPRMNTTHVSAIDRWGNSASLTSTLLGGWGSGVTVPGTGVLLNNGMMWFDPVPGRPNSIAGGKRPLANMAPMILLDENRAFLSLGAMGGRRILNALPQIVANVVDYNMGMQAAISAPRIDCSTGAVQASSRIPPDTLAALRRIGHTVEIIEEDMLSFEFGSPVGVQNDSGTLRGGANLYYPAMAIAVP